MPGVEGFDEGDVVSMVRSAVGRFGKSASGQVGMVQGKGDVLADVDDDAKETVEPVGVVHVVDGVEEAEV